jgi:hypothetical protein
LGELVALISLAPVGNLAILMIVVLAAARLLVHRIDSI